MSNVNLSFCTSTQHFHLGSGTGWKSADSVSFAIWSISVRNRHNISKGNFYFCVCWLYQRKNKGIGWQRNPVLDHMVSYWRLFSSISKKLSILKFFVVDIEVLSDDIKQTSISGIIYGMIYCFDFWWSWQDQILACTLLPAMPPTTIQMMIAHLMRMNAFSLINCE